MDKEDDLTLEEEQILNAKVGVTDAQQALDQARDIYAWRVKRYLSEGGSAVRLAEVLGVTRSAVYQTADRAPAQNPTMVKSKRVVTRAS